MEEKKQNKKALIVAITLVLLLLVTGTYAWMVYSKSSLLINKITAGTLDLVLDESTTNGIHLENQMPMPYQKGIMTDPYEFSLKNNSSISSNYVLSLEDFYDSSVLNESKLGDSKIRYILLKNDEEPSATNSRLLSDGRGIDIGTITGGETINYKLYIWIDSKAGEEINGKIFSAKLNLVAEQVNNTTRNTAYLWNNELLLSYSIDTVISECRKLGINELYIAFSNIEDNKSAIKKLKSNNIKVYSAIGDPSWYNSYTDATHYIDKVDTYNRNNTDAKLDGVVLDIEPYLNAEYQDDPITGFETYVDIISQLYSYSKNKNLKFINTVSYWYDNYMSDPTYSEAEHQRATLAFDKLYSNVDRMTVMNYYKGAEQNHLANEYTYAKNKNKEIETISELSIADENITSNVTYFVDDKPLEKVQSVWRNLASNYNYDKLTFSYHHLAIVLGLDNKAKKYDFEFIDENNNKLTSKEFIIKLSANDVVTRSTDTRSGVYILNNKNFNITMDGYKVLSYTDEDISPVEVKRTYRVATLSSEKYEIEMYPRYSDSNLIENGTLKLINNENLNEVILDYRAAGLFYYNNLYSNTSYKVIYIDPNGNEKQLDHATCSGDLGNDIEISDGNGNIIVPTGFRAEHYIGGKFYFKN